MSILGKTVALGIFVGGAALVGVAGYIYTYSDPEPLPQAAAIVVLSGPGGDVPGTDGETRLRVDRGVALFGEGLAPLIAMTGHGIPGDETAHATHMAARAIELGVPETAILQEGNSFSTLQNALFVRALDEIDTSAPVILVSHRYHLPRAWASFRWAGFSDITLVAADEGPIQITSMLLQEGLKWPFNMVRAAGASIAFAAGAEEPQVTPWLR